MGTPQIEVTFSLDANGILNVSAKDKGTSKEQKIRIESSGGLTKDEIERMQRDADAHAAEDKKKRELAEARNTAEQRVYQLEKLMSENQDKLNEGDKSAVQTAIAKVQETLKGEDAAAINAAVEDLQRASQAMAEHLYAASATTGAASGGAGGGESAGETAGAGATAGGKADDVIDVEFEEKK
jgi:molecular chaperone DnaK